MTRLPTFLRTLAGTFCWRHERRKPCEACAHPGYRPGWTVAAGRAGKSATGAAA